MEKRQAIVADKWSAFEPDIAHNFFGFPPLRPYLIETAFGKALADEHRDNPHWAEDILIAAYLRDRRIESVLSLCCGFGSVERRVVMQLPGVRQCVGVDLAAGALEAARQRAAAAGLQNTAYVQADLNAYDWEAEKYDLVIANGALHHLWNLEGVLEGVRRTLKPGGLLYANEHVGASYQDYPPRQLELINAVAYLVPPELRERSPHRRYDRLLKLLHRLYNIPEPAGQPAWSSAKKALASALRRLFAPGSLDLYPGFGVLHRAQKDHLLRTDPSEGVRSAEIIPLIEQYFTDVEVRSYGGGLLAYALDRAFYHGFDADNPAHAATLALLCAVERHAVATGQIGIEHAIIIAHP